MTKMRGERREASPDAIYKLHFDEKSGPPRKTFHFIIEHLKTGKQQSMRLTTAVGWDLASIVEKAYSRVGGLGAAVIIPSSAVVNLWSDCTVWI